MRQEDAYEGPTVCGGRILQENPSGLRFRNLEFTASLNYLVDIQERSHMTSLSHDFCTR